MNNLKSILSEEIDEFRKQGHKFLNKEINKMEFKGISGGMGVYAERDMKKFMIRLRIPSGVTDLNEFKKIYEFAKKYKLDDIHFTTRQAVQFHGMTIDEVCNLMKEALECDIYTRGSGGNFPRNVALSPLSGVDKKEAFDPTKYALAVGNYFLERIYTYKLPRKIKVSFSNTEEDTAHITVQDIGFLPIIQNGKKWFRAYIGGGLGMNAKTALEVPQLIEPEDILYYIQGMVNLFIEHGDYKNRARARIRYIRDKMSDDEFVNIFNEYANKEKSKGGLFVEKYSLKDDCNIIKKGIETPIKHHRLYEQKQKGLYSVLIHPYGGKLKTSDLKKIIDILESFEEGYDIRLSMCESFYVRNLNGREAEKLLEETMFMGGDTLLEQSVSCIGVPTCQMGICNSQKLLKDILDYFEKQNRKSDALPRLYISGCHNSCAVHQIGKIGFFGKKKRVNDEVKDVFSICIGGSCCLKDVKMAEVKGDMLPERIPVFLHELGRATEKAGLNFDSYINEKSNEFEMILSKYIV